MHPLIQEIEKAQRKDSVPEFGPGDTVRVHVKVVEGGKERIQIFEGTVIFRKEGLSRAAFMVRKISNGLRGRADVFDPFASRRQN